MKIYTGVGDHKVAEIPQQRLVDTTVIARTLETWGFFLRSGGATGFDTAFERGVVDPNHMKIYDKDTNLNVSEELWSKAVEIALRNHKYPQNAMKFIRWLGRNPFQVLGDNLDQPSLFLICWTANGKDIGGTGTTMRVAKEYNVPIYNLYSTTKDQILGDIYCKYVEPSMVI